MIVNFDGISKDVGKRDATTKKKKKKKKRGPRRSGDDGEYWR